LQFLHERFPLFLFSHYHSCNRKSFWNQRPLLHSELKNKPIARKSIVAAKPIDAGEKFTNHNLTAKRPGTGVSPMLWDKVIGQVAQKDYEKDELI